jgi:hypothetical protein
MFILTEQEKEFITLYSQKQFADCLQSILNKTQEMFPYEDPGLARIEPYNTDRNNAIVAQAVQSILKTFKS